MSSLYERIIAQQKSKGLALHFCPRVVDLPLPMQRFDDPFLPYGKAVINASREHVSLYVFDVPSYLAIGAAGAVALERTIDFLNDEIPCVLHGPFGGAAFVKLLDKLAFGADALTISREQGVVELIDDKAQRQGEWMPSGEIQLGYNAQVLKLRVLGDEFVYAHRQFDFQEALQAAFSTL
ncbi:MAG: hypothetical protein SNJ54_05755 [Anaerolineae bacterium]